MRNHPQGDPAQMEQRHIVGLLRHLYVHLALGLGGSHVHNDDTSDLREILLCEFIHLRKAIPLLPCEERRVILMVGLQGLSEREVADRLGLTQKAVNKRLWSAAERIRKSWQGRRRGGAWPGGTPGGGGSSGKNSTDSASSRP